MLKPIGTLTLLCALFLGANQTASAHDRGVERHLPPRHHQAVVHRDRVMPRWLRHDHGFHAWYQRTSLRNNHHLAWWQLLDIYRWERRHDHRRHDAAHYGSRHHDYDWYRRYWHKRDRHRHDRRGHGKREWRHRDGH